MQGSGKKEILVIGRHSFMLEKVCSLLNESGYQARGCVTDAEAFLMMKAYRFDAVVIGGGVETESVNLFEQEFPKINETIKIIRAHPHSVLQDLRSAFPN